MSLWHTPCFSAVLTAQRTAQEHKNRRFIPWLFREAPNEIVMEMHISKKSREADPE
jgi:hypothetical protein